MLDELWNEVRDIVQETGIKAIPVEKKCNKANSLSEDALQTAEKGREVNGNGEKKRYTHRTQSSKEKQGEVRKPS